jgi:hypothetical protein
MVHLLIWSVSPSRAKIPKRKNTPKHQPISTDGLTDALYLGNRRLCK